MKPRNARLLVLTLVLMAATPLRSSDGSHINCDSCGDEVNSIPVPHCHVSTSHVQAHWTPEMQAAGNTWCSEPCEFQRLVDGSGTERHFGLAEGKNVSTRMSLDTSRVVTTGALAAGGRAFGTDTALSSGKVFYLAAVSGCYGVQSVSEHEFGLWLSTERPFDTEDVVNPANTQTGHQALNLSGNAIEACVARYPPAAIWRGPICAEGVGCTYSRETCSTKRRQYRQGVSNRLFSGATSGVVKNRQSFPPPPPSEGGPEGGDFDPVPCHPNELNPDECDDGVGGGSAGGNMAASSINMEMCPDRNSQKNAWDAASIDPEDLEYRPSCAGCGNGLGLAMRRELRKMMGFTSNGRRYLSLWNTHRMEVVAIFDANPELGALVGSRVNDFMPGLRTWLYNDINGSNFTLDATRIAQIEEVVNAIKQCSSAALQSDLDGVMDAIRLEQGKTVKSGLAHFLGLTL